MRLKYRLSNVTVFVLCIAAFGLYCTQRSYALERHMSTMTSDNHSAQSFLSQASSENSFDHAHFTSMKEHDNSRRRLSQDRSRAQEESDVECSLDASIVQSIYDEATQQWTVDDNTLDEVNNEIQAIVNCSGPDDVILFQTERILQTQNTVTIPWNLTLSSFSEDGLLDNGEIREVESKVRFTCPDNGVLFAIHTPSFTLANMIFEDCNSNSSIIEWNPECNNPTNRNQGRFLHVSFKGNTLFDDANLINAGNASCARMEMNNVVIQRNRCAKTHCIVLSEDNILRNLQVLGNNGSTSASLSSAIFSIGRDSETVVSNITCQRNEIRYFSVQNGTLSVRDSHFEGNTHNPSRDPLVALGGGVIFSNHSTISITNSSFLHNNASTGGCISTLASDLNIKECTFIGNGAQEGGCLLLNMSSNVDVSSSNFTNNVASENGGVVLIEERCLLNISRSNFTSNTAAFGGTIFTTLNSNISISDSNLTQNEATYGGSVSALGRSSVFLSNSEFSRNRADRYGGAIYLNSSRLSVNYSSLNLNEAQEGGSIYFRNESSVIIDQSNFSLNRADFAGGGIHVLENGSLVVFGSHFEDNISSGGAAVSITRLSEAMVSNSTFLNSFGWRGDGAVFVFRDSSLTLTGCNFTNNSASSGGCVVLRDSCSATVRNCVFRNSQATRYGGAIYVHVNSSLLLSHSILERNEGRSGGGLAAVDYTNVSVEFSEFMENNAIESGGGIYLQNREMRILSSQWVSNQSQFGGALGIHDDSMFEATNSTFEGNSVRERGGAMYILSSNATLTGVQITANEASSIGGGVYSVNGSHITANNITVVSNSARNEGGGMVVVNGSSFLCYSCNFLNNTAASGAGLYVFLNDFIPIVAQLENCVFENNTAQSHGGGLEFAAPQNRSNNCNDPNMTCGYILLLNTSFIDNYAEFTGAAVLTTDTGRVLVSCNYNETRDGGFLSEQIISSLERINPEGLCSNWMRNRLLSDVYDGTVGTFASKLSLSIAPGEEVSFINDIESGMVLMNVSSGRPWPVLFVTLLDEYGLGPAPTQPLTFEATLSSPDGFFPGVYPVNITGGSGNFTQVIGFATPGNYSIEVRSGIDDLESVVVTIIVRNCTVGEESAADGTFCQQCSALEYNFNPSEERGCTPCPDDATCEERYIIPNDGYWHKSPCHDTVKECLIEAACEKDNRLDTLKNFTQNFTDCEWNTTTLETYNQELCNEGYEGPLCGSCKKSYGLSLRFECLECPRSFLSLLLLFFIIIYLIGISAITIRGCLPLVSILSRPNRLSVIETQRDEPMEQEPVDEGVNYQMVEMMVLGHVPPEVLRPQQQTIVGTTPIKQTEELEMTRWKTTEVLKILINFLQTTAIAASINVEWTDGVSDMFSTSEYIGALTTAALSNPIDCLLSTDSAHTRSIVRTILSILVIVVVMAVFIVLFGVITIRENKGNRYFWKRSLLSVIAVTYISYLGLTKLAVRMFYCVDVYDSEDPFSDEQNTYLAFDTSIECFKKDHVPLIVIAVFVLLFVSFLFPLTSAIILTRHKADHRETGSWTMETMGFLFRAFKEEFAFWESLIMLRKAGLSIIVVFSYPLSGQIQGLLALLVLLFSLYLHFTCLPYRKEFHGLNHYESASLLVSCFTFIIGQFFDSDKCSDSTKEVIAVLIILLNVVFLSFLLFSLIQSSINHLRAVLQYEGVCISDDAKWWTILKTFVSFQMTKWCKK